jgi:hypothetical protein
MKTAAIREITMVITKIIMTPILIHFAALGVFAITKTLSIKFIEIMN